MPFATNFLNDFGNNSQNMNGYSSVIIYPNLNRKMCFFSLISLTMANNFLLVFFFFFI